MKTRTRRLGATLLAAASLAVTACGSDSSSSSATTAAAGGDGGGTKPSIVVGSADFPENQLLMEIYAQQLEKNGYTVSRKPAIGSREVYYKAITASPPEIDLVPEYTNSLLSYVVKSKDPNATISARNVTEQVAELGKVLPATLTVGTPSTAEDKDVIVCRKDVADTYSLKTLSDLAKVSGEITLGAPPEFENRSPFGIAGFKEIYGATFKAFVPLQVGDVPASIVAKKIDCGNVFSTNPEITTNGFVALEDDKNTVPNEAVLPLVTTRVATPEVMSILDGVSAKLNTENLKAMMVEVITNKKAVDVVAKEFVGTL